MTTQRTIYIKGTESFVDDAVNKMFEWHHSRKDLIDSAGAEQDFGTLEKITLEKKNLLRDFWNKVGLHLINEGALSLTEYQEGECSVSQKGNEAGNIVFRPKENDEMLSDLFKFLRETKERVENAKPSSL